MLKTVVTSHVLLFILFGFSTYVSASGHQSAYAAGELLIKFKKDFVSNKPELVSAVNIFQSQNKIRRKQQNLSNGIQHWALEKGVSIPDAINQLKNDPSIEIVEPNYYRYPHVVTTEANAFNQSVKRIAQIRLDKLQEVINPNRQVTIAVLDDAFDLSHADLVGRDYYRPYNAVEDNNDVSPDQCFDSANDLSSELHGTTVLSVIAANIDNKIGVQGAIKDVRIMPIKLGCNYTIAAEFDAIDWAVENGANIINMSYGGPQFSEISRLKIAELIDKNILVIAAAGNFDVNNDRVPDYPSGLDLPNVLAVAAVDEGNNLTGWSQFGPTRVDVAAPGENFGVTYVGNQYATENGTSFSAPLVAAAAATLFSSVRDASIYDVKGALMASVKPFADGNTGKLVTDGYVDAYAAFQVMDDRKPVPVISQIKIIDDNGNNNRQIDRFENVEIELTIENVWGDANTLDMVLTSPDLLFAPMRETINAGLGGYNDSTNTFGQLVRRFQIDFGERYAAQGVRFQLAFSGLYGALSNQTFNYTRSFSIDPGNLSLDTPIVTQIRKNDQDEVHYYHITTTSTIENLEFTLTADNLLTAADDVDLMVKKNVVPEFEYQFYTNLPHEDWVSSGTQVSANINDSNESISFNNAKAGTYFVVVIASHLSKLEKIPYTLTVSAGSQSTLRGAVSGCTLNPSATFDPTLFIIMLIAMIGIRVSHRFDGISPNKDNNGKKKNVEINRS